MVTTEEFFVMDAIARINREMSQSYPYKSGSAVINTRCCTKNVLMKILQHYMDRKSFISINYDKKQVTITDFLGGF